MASHLVSNTLIRCNYDFKSCLEIVRMKKLSSMDPINCNVPDKDLEAINKLIKEESILIDQNLFVSQLDGS